MTHTDSMNGDASLVQGDSLVPINPFHALRYQFGMLLGVEDFEAAQAYARGKTRLHNAWLHGEGVVWGFRVSSDLTKGEIRVDPGLALDALGHELHLDSSACVNVPAWYLEHQQEDEHEETRNAGGLIAFDVRVELRFRACLTRPVPAMVQPCEGGAKGVGYSRAFETVEIKLLRGAPKLAPRPYHLLRMLFGLEGPIDSTSSTETEKLVQQTLTEIASLPPDRQAPEFLEAFRRFAAWDGITRQPGKSAANSRDLLFPGQEDAPVVLATATVALKPDGHGGFALAHCDVDTTARRTHVETATIQELNLLALTGAGAAGKQPARVDRCAIGIDRTEITLPLTAPLNAKTVQAKAFRLVALHDEGWTSVPIVDVAQSQKHGATVIKIETNPLDPQLTHRLVARGSGAEALLGKDGQPFGGATDDPRRPTKFDGIDFVHMWKKAAP